MQKDPNDEIQFAKDCCCLYFNNYQKAKVEIILKEHYFKMYAFRLNPIFVYQRITLYFCYLILNTYEGRAQKLTQLLHSCIQILAKIYEIIVNIITTTDKSQPPQSNNGFRSGLQIAQNTKNQMNNTFRILKLVSELQHEASGLKNFVQMILQHEKNQELFEIYKTLKQFLKQQPFGIGSKCYENFIKTQMLLSWKYLRVPPTPFLPPKKPTLRYTIVLDLDETILYYNQQVNLLKFRPYLEPFLSKLKEMQFQIISFSASSKSYSDTIIGQLEHKSKIFQYRLYRQHLSLFNGRLVKDLRRLGRDLSKVLIIDDLSVNFSSCPQNGIEVGSWQGDKGDQQLLSLIPFFSKIQKLENMQRQVEMRELIAQNKNFLESILEGSSLKVNI